MLTAGEWLVLLVQVGLSEAFSARIRTKTWFAAGRARCVATIRARSVEDTVDDLAALRQFSTRHDSAES